MLCLAQKNRVIFMMFTVPDARGVLGFKGASKHGVDI